MSNFRFSFFIFDFCFFCFTFSFSFFFCGCYVTKEALCPHVRQTNGESVAMVISYMLRFITFLFTFFFFRSVPRICAQLRFLCKGQSRFIC